VKYKLEDWTSSPSRGI